MEGPLSRKKKVEVEVLEVDYDVVVKESTKPACFDKKQAFCRRELCPDYFDECKYSLEKDELV